MNIGFLNLAIVKFYSRIVLRKISRVSLTQYRKVENEYKKLLKLNADIRYNNDRGLWTKPSIKFTNAEIIVFYGIVPYY